MDKLSNRKDLSDIIWS